MTCTGAVVQLVVLGLFVLFGVGLLGPGVFEHEALSGVPVAVRAAAISGLQLVLLGVQIHLSGSRRSAPDLGAIGLSGAVSC